ncbi:MAG: prenyltransferase/squalene oxidase repeat-containing protein [Verrucomicrobiota bacterium]|nr:prenyltransferase/squalene oxidase repeat-containing protein [Verrucomicrobiota bacterium]
MLNRITLLLPMSLMTLVLATNITVYGATGTKGQGSGVSTGGSGAPGSVKGSGGGDPSANRRALRFSPGQRVSGRPLLANPQVLSAYKASMNLSITWLVKEQNQKGHWPNKGGRVADTGLAILCLLSYGVLPQDKTPAGAAVATGLDWLASKVSKQGDMRDSGRMYSQAIGTWALGEAYNLSKQAQYKKPLEDATEFLIKSQHPKSGGWRYTPPPFKSASDIGDTSVGGWAMPAVASAKLAGVQVPKKVTDNANDYLDAVSGGKEKGLYGYSNSRRPTPSCTAIGMFCQQLIGNPKAPNYKARQGESAKLLSANPPSAALNTHAAGCGMYHYYFYGTLAMFHHGGTPWQDWEDKLISPLMKAQNTDGSWDPVASKKPATKSKVISTAWATMCLSVYNQVLPVFNMGKGGKNTSVGGGAQGKGSSGQ